MNKAAGGLLVVTHLHQRSCEVKIGYVGRFPLWCLRWKAISDSQFRTAAGIKNRRIKAESGAHDHAIVADVLLHLVRASKAQSHEIGSIAAFNVLDVSVEQCVLRLELIRIEQIVVDRA